MQRVAEAFGVQETQIQYRSSIRQEKQRGGGGGGGGGLKHPPTARTWHTANRSRPELELEALEGQAGLVNPSLREGLEDHGGLRERNVRNITVGTDILYFRGGKMHHHNYI
ncbi:hypothetical protein FQN60_017689 [Etheostoma spectabile]|uniref:Uncharacterized protein n=1 Tax=Etheostoma spectabile TaxID=54343 RepID=A0A5J5DFW4_9PERO|nr:hypothetical protein FQN60_017689 [Etheostoma spectabile]